MLNNRGWGLKEMLILSGIILFFLMLVVFLVNSFYQNFSEGINSSSNNSSNSSSSNYTYEDVEASLKEAAQKYVAKNANVGAFVTSQDLIDSNYLRESKMKVNNDTCEGYVMIEDQLYTPYITCGNSYTTEGY